MCDYTPEMYNVYDKIKWHGDKHVQYIDQPDYNVYYMPDNNIYTDFFCENRIV